MDIPERAHAARRNFCLVYADNWNMRRLLVHVLTLTRRSRPEVALITSRSIRHCFGERSCRVLEPGKRHFRSDAGQKARSLQKPPRFCVQVGQAEPEIVAPQLCPDLVENTGSGAVDRGDCFGVKYEPPCRPRLSGDDPSDPVTYIVDVEEHQTALHQIDGQARDLLCLRLAVQFIETVTAGDAA